MDQTLHAAEDSTTLKNAGSGCLCHKTQNVTNTTQGTACAITVPAMQADSLGGSLNFCSRQGKGKGPTAWDPRPTKPLATGQQREKHKQKQQKAPHTSDLSGGTRGAGDKTTKGDNNVCPENTTQLAVCGSKKKGPSVSVPFAAAQQGPEQRRRGRCCTAGAREHGKTPSSVSPRVFASVFLPSVPLLVLPSLKTTSRKKSAGPRALVG